MWAHKTIDVEIPIEIRDLDVPHDPQPIVSGTS
jgi:hypothetical protein